MSLVTRHYSHALDLAPYSVESYSSHEEDFESEIKEFSGYVQQYLSILSKYQKDKKVIKRTGGDLKSLKEDRRRVHYVGRELRKGVRYYARENQMSRARLLSILQLNSRQFRIFTKTHFRKHYTKAKSLKKRHHVSLVVPRKSHRSQHSHKAPSVESRHVHFRSRDSIAIIPRRLTHQLESGFSVQSKHGLTNMGNTCFANALTQAIFIHSPVITELLDQELTPVNGERADSPQHILRCLLQADLKKLVLEMKKRDPDQGVVNQLLRDIWQSPILQEHLNVMHDQEDASELLMYLLDALQISKLTNLGIAQGSVISATDGSGKKTVKVDGINIRSRIPEHHPVLFLNIDKSNPTLQGCVDFTLANETLSRDNWFRYDGDRRTRPTNKKMFLTSLDPKKLSAPEGLILCIKRFTHNRKKDNTPISGIDKEIRVPIYDWTGENLIYHLVLEPISIVNHSGTVRGGHYTAEAKHGSKWVNYNNSWVSNPKTNSGSEVEGYLLSCRTKRVEYA